MKDRIRQLMESMHMNQQTFANHIHLSTATLSSILLGRTKPTLNTVEAIRKYCPTVNLGWLMNGMGEMYITPENATSADGLTSAAGPEGGNIDNVDGSMDLFSGSAGQPGMSADGSSYATTVASTSSQSQQYSSGFQSNGRMSQPGQRGSFPSGMSRSSSSVHSAAMTAQQIDPRQQARNIGIEMKNIDKYTRHITEIRVYYDDQTWETFLPKH